MTTRYLVSYDLHHQSSATYDMVGQVIERYGDAFRFQESEWVVASDYTAEEIANALHAVAGKKDKIFVVQFTGTYRIGHTQGLKNWLDRHPLT